MHRRFRSKRKRPSVTDFPDDQFSTRTGNLPSSRVRADPSTQYYAMLSGGTPQQVPPGDYRGPAAEREELGFSSERVSRLQDVRNRKGRSRSPVRNRGRRFSSDRYDERDYHQRIPASAHRPGYHSPPRPGLASSESKGSSTHNSQAEMSHPGRSNTVQRGQVPVPMQTSLEASNRSPANVSHLSPADATKEFGLLLHQLIDEATDLAALKNQKNAARKDFERKDGEFKKSKPIHEKFPATEEVQRRSKDQAMKVLNSMIEKCQKKDATLKDIALQGAVRFVPGLIEPAAGRHDQEKLQAQVEALEKTCQDFQKQLQEQQKFIQEQQKSREALERKHHELAAKYGNAQGDWGITKNRQAQFDHDVRPKLQEVLQKISTSEGDIEALKREASAVTRKLSEMSEKTPADLGQKLDKLDSLSGRVDDCLKLRLDFSKAKEESSKGSKVIASNCKILEEYGQKLENLETFVRGDGGGREGLSRHVTTLAQDQESFRAELKKWQAVRSDITQLEDRVTAVESRTDPASLETRLARAETLLQLSARELMAKVETRISDNIEQRLKTVETRYLPTTSPSNDLLHSFQSQLSLLEQQVRNIPNIEKWVEYLENYVKSSTLDDFRAELMATVKTLVDLKDKDFFARHPSPSTQASKPDLSPFQERLKSVEKEIEFVSVLRNHLGDVENKVLPLDNIQRRLDAVEEEAIPTRLAFFERRLTALETPRRFAESLAPPLTSPATVSSGNVSFDLETIKEEIMVVVAESQSVADKIIVGKIEGLDARVHGLETRDRSAETRFETMNTINEQLFALSAVVQKFQQAYSQTENRLSSTIGQLEAKYNTWVRSQQAINGVLEDRVEAVSIGIINIDRRLATINTKDLALHMISQLEHAYPDVRFVQDTVADCKKSLHQAENSLSEFGNTVLGLRVQVEAIESRFQQHPDLRTTQALRNEVNDLTLCISKIGTLSKEAKDGLAVAVEKFYKNEGVLEDRLGEMRMEIKELKDHQKALSKVQPPPPNPASKSTIPGPSVETSDRAPFSYGNGVNFIRGGSRLISDRHTSGEPAGKKRKIVNGRPASSTTNGNHATSPKKRKKLFIESDTSDDSNFEPIEPRISDDDDEE